MKKLHHTRGSQKNAFKPKGCYGRVAGNSLSLEISLY